MHSELQRQVDNQELAPNSISNLQTMDVNVSVDADQGSSPPRHASFLRPLLGFAALVLAASTFFSIGEPAGSSEQDFSAWTNHVKKLDKQFDETGVSQIKHANTTGGMVLTDKIQVSESDRNQAKTASVQTAIKSGDAEVIERAVKEAIEVPESSDKNGDPVTVPQPVLTTGLVSEIAQAGVAFYHIYLYDCCYEDGDVVQIRINGLPFATVPITNTGVTLSVPINGPSSSIELEGITDGGGGITVACRTSQGDFFMRSMYEGEIQPIGIVRQ